MTLCDQRLPDSIARFANVKSTFFPGITLTTPLFETSKAGLACLQVAFRICAASPEGGGLKWWLSCQIKVFLRRAGLRHNPPKEKTNVGSCNRLVAACARLRHTRPGQEQTYERLYPPLLDRCLRSAHAHGCTTPGVLFNKLRTTFPPPPNEASASPQGSFPASNDGHIAPSNRKNRSSAIARSRPPSHPRQPRQQRRLLLPHRPKLH